MSILYSLKLLHFRDLLSPSTINLLIDWLLILDPELTHISPSYEHKLIFGQHFASLNKNLQHSSLLLNLLIHNSSLDTLSTCLDSLLSGSLELSNPTSVLDYFTALLQLPKVWQGKEKRQSIVSN